MSLEEAIAVIVPLCLDLKERHTRGERLYVHPSAIAPGADGLARINPRLALAPTHPLDKHCLAPELQGTLEPGDACSSVYSIGAILYEMVTGQHVGPAMKRPRDIEPSLPESTEVLIGKAIIGDRAHRPADLGALASAIYHVAPQKSIHPPEVSEERLDASAELAVDVRFSMLPPGEGPAQPLAADRRPMAPRGVATSMEPVASPRPAHVAPNPGVPAPPDRADAVARPDAPGNAAGLNGNKAVADDPTARLAALKQRLESDPRPRYVVSKDKMDHGPFTAVELLQQIASHAFSGEHGLRDEISGQQMPIGEWEEFAPFAEQAALLREKRAEEKAVVRAADADKKRGVAKSIVASSVVVALGGVFAVWFFARRGVHNDVVVIAEDRTGSVEINGDIKGRKSAHHGGGGGGGGYSSGRSYESVLNGNNETIGIDRARGAADLTNAQLSAPLRHTSFISACGAPDSMKVQIRVAVKMGRAVGVTVTTNPPSSGIAACIDRSVRGLQWAQSTKTDFVTTNY